MSENRFPSDIWEKKKSGGNILLPISSSATVLSEWQMLEDWTLTYYVVCLKHYGLRGSGDKMGKWREWDIHFFDK